MRKLLTLLSLLIAIQHQAMAQCNAGFSSSINGPTVQFTASSPNGFHIWKFGDNYFGNGATTTHIYSAPGTYNVMHIVRDSLNNCVDSLLQTVTVNFTPGCTSSFIMGGDSANNQYTFTSTSTIVGGFIQSHNWTLDGQPITANASFTRTLSAGVHTVCLTISTSLGCTSNSCQTFTVVNNVSCNWTANFTDSVDVNNPRLIHFSPVPDLQRMRYIWDFGDGSTSTMRRPSHMYSVPGNYQVKLVINDTLYNCLDTVIRNIQVNGSAQDSCTVSYSYAISPSQGNMVSFTAISNQGITSQIWTILSADSINNAVLYTNNPTHVFNALGQYQVCLTITTNTGCTRTFCNTIAITSFRLEGRIIPSYPNPVNGVEVTVPLVMEQAARIKLTVYNLSGNAVYSSEHNANTGSNNIKIPVGSLQRGQYYVEIRIGNERRRSLFQKL